jgi:cation:H+ antiporter
MALTLALLGAGALLLYLGAEAAVRGATGLSRALRIPAFTLGALLFGVDIEGLGAALVAAGRGQTEIAAGESFGTILFLFSLALGAALLFARSPVPSPSPGMVALPALPLVACAVAISDRFVARWEGALLVVIYAAYVVMVVLRANGEGEGAGPEGVQGGSSPARRSGADLAAASPLGEAPRRRRGAEKGEEGSPEAPPTSGRPTVRLVLVTAAGLLLVYLGATVLVAGGTRLVDLTTLSAGFVGAAVVGVLTSLDEVLLEVLPIRRGEPGLATGNLFGTLAAFTTGVPGLAALIRPLVLDGAAAAAFLGVALLYFVVGTSFLARGKAGRLVGVTVVILYAAWLALTSTV